MCQMFSYTSANMQPIFYCLKKLPNFAHKKTVEIWKKSSSSNTTYNFSMNYKH
jgi:hypothetical protein